ncbi:MAG: GNAT family N-acetyltransferase [Candidatus Aegiribacteria sp.]|nr:GNAT family N-acetyltransferase [Candidatus Aegiribacteria sp.]MBD3294580.1 GNAT family N-acetyltransferase [Candidatus Fermentibacteria bacterium]
MIQYRYLRREDLEVMRGIDRSDYSHRWCSVRNGHIVQEERVFHHRGFSSSDWDRIITEFSNALDRNRMVIAGALEDGKLLGIAGLDTAVKYGIKKDMYNLGPMWVSREHRGRGIGKELFGMMVQKALEHDIEALYVSSTPSPATVDFYIGLGCKLLKEPDPILFEEEPEDIHLRYELDRQRFK